MLRTITFAVLVALAVFAATIWEAASVTGRLTKVARNASADTSSSNKVALLNMGKELASGSWARPELWHAGYLESSSWIEAQISQQTANPELQKSAALLSRDAAQRAVSIAPVHAGAWLRLADYGRIGHPNSICLPEDCLRASWNTRPVSYDYAFACNRLKLAHAVGVRLSDEGAYIQSFIRLFGRKQAAKCLRFLPQEEVYSLLIARSAPVR